MIRRPQVLLVDDEVAMVRSLELLLKSVADIHKAYSVPEADDFLMKNQRIDCVITDVCMPEASGLTLLDQLRAKNPEIPVVVMTAFSSVPQAVEAIQRGAFEYIVKPFENSELVSIVKRAIQKRGLNHGETRLMPTGWICNSPAMIEFVEKLDRLKNSDSSLLLLGESGSGKGRAARWLHDQGARAKREFFSVDGRALDEDNALLNRNLSKVGTLFVGEILSLSRRLQDRLFEIVKDGRIRIIGGSSVMPEVQAPCHFRDDLFQELTALTLKVPSLRQRQEDLEALVAEILSQISGKLKSSPLQIHPAAIEHLRTHSFAGNVRELEQVLERAAIESKGSLVRNQDIRFGDSDLRSQLPFAIPTEDGWNRVELLKQNLERDLIVRSLDQNLDKSNTQIAEMLGTTRRILELRMKEYKIREGS